MAKIYCAFNCAGVCIWQWSERDKTSWKGKFFIYEQVIRPAFYGIYEVQKAAISYQMI